MMNMSETIISMLNLLTYFRFLKKYFRHFFFNLFFLHLFISQFYFFYSIYFKFFSYFITYLLFEKKNNHYIMPFDSWVNNTGDIF